MTDTSKKEKQLKILKVNGTKKQQQQTWNIDTLTEWLIDGKNKDRRMDGQKYCTFNSNNNDDHDHDVED